MHKRVEGLIGNSCHQDGDKERENRVAVEVVLRHVPRDIERVPARKVVPKTDLGPD